MKGQTSISIVDYLAVIVKWRVFLIRNVFIVTAIAIIISLVLPHKFTVTAALLPPSSQQEAFLGMFSSLGLPGGLSTAALAQGGLPGMVTPSDLYAAIMNSASIRGAIVKKYDLQKEFKTKTMDDTYKALDRIVDISTSPEGIISVSVTYKNKYLAADIANSFVEELDRFNTEVAMTTGKKYRIFIEKRLNENIDSLQEAENALRVFQEKHHTVALEVEIEGVIATIAELKSEIILLEVQKAAIGSPGDYNNPHVRNINRQLKELNKQLSKIEFGDTLQHKKEFGAGFAVPLSELPEVAVQYARLLRDVEVQAAIYEILTQQYEQAKIMELKDTPTVQFLDRASPPEKRSFPKRRLIVILAAFFSGIFSIIFIFTLEYIDNAKQNVALYNKWQYIASEFKKDYKSIKSRIKKRRKKP